MPPKLTVHSDTAKAAPVDAVLADSIGPARVTDPAGRTFELCKPPILARYRLVKMIGKAADSQTYLSMVLPLIYVRSIDGSPITVNSERELDALIALVGDEGMNFLIREVEKRYFPQEDVDSVNDIKN